jgi:lycopene elongase/hydratase (dihydrobisanhydrobacterioruberin-forming)
MFKKYVLISRPRFWLYLLGPLLVGAAAAQGTDIDWQRLLPFILFFSFPANLLIYGFNDIFDYETDKYNKKKQSYEQLLSPRQRGPLLRQLIIWGAIGILLVFPADVSQAAKWAMVGFYFFGLFYSVPPIRAKARPFIDALFNILYIFPGLLGYSLFTGNFPPTQLMLAATFWVMAMHAYSAVPDISSDKKAKLSTIATTLGARGTLIFCWFGYVASAALSYSYLGMVSILGGFVYSVMMLLSLRSKDIFEIYRYFPLVNMLMGLVIFLYAIL